MLDGVDFAEQICRSSCFACCDARSSRRSYNIRCSNCSPQLKQIACVSQHVDGSFVDPAKEVCVAQWCGPNQQSIWFAEDDRSFTFLKRLCPSDTVHYEAFTILACHACWSLLAATYSCMRERGGPSKMRCGGSSCGSIGPSPHHTA